MTSALMKSTPPVVGAGIPLVARHEAAHVVVAVALGLPLESVTIEGSRIGPLRLAGCTVLTRSASGNWRRDWRDLDARATLTDEATMSAAGIVSDLTSGARLGDRGARTDLFKVVRIAGMLGVGAALTERPVRIFLADAIERAAKILRRADCEEWNIVAQTLAREGALTGDHARALASGGPRRTLPAHISGRALARSFAQEYGRLALTLGGFVRAADVEYGIDTTVRLLKIERDLLNNTNTRLTLANRPILFTSIAGRGATFASGPVSALVSSGGSPAVLTPPAPPAGLNADGTLITYPVGTIPPVLPVGNTQTQDGKTVGITDPGSMPPPRPAPIPVNGPRFG